MAQKHTTCWASASVGRPPCVMKKSSATLASNRYGSFALSVGLYSTSMNMVGPRWSPSTEVDQHWKASEGSGLIHRRGRQALIHNVPCLASDVRPPRAKDAPDHQSDNVNHREKAYTQNARGHSAAESETAEHLARLRALLAFATLPTVAGGILFDRLSLAGIRALHFQDGSCFVPKPSGGWSRATRCARCDGRGSRPASTALHSRIPCSPCTQRGWIAEGREWNFDSSFPYPTT